MSSSTFNHTLFIFQPVHGAPEYINFTYSFHWPSILTIFKTAYNFLGVTFFFKICTFYFLNEKKVKSSGLSPRIFQSFLLMQFWCILAIVGETLLMRIPLTGFFTSYCASENPQLLLKAILLFFYVSHYSCQLFTVLFCAMRVIILYSMDKEGKGKIVPISSPIFILTSCILCIPQLLTTAVCVQMYAPYPFGSVMISSMFYVTHRNTIAMEHLIFTGTTTVVLVALNISMLWKIRSSKKTTPESTSEYKTRAERTLTVTMVILTIPLVVFSLLMIAQLFFVDAFAYALFCSTLIEDIRVHVVTCYFYFRHPVFKKEDSSGRVSNKISTTS